MRRKRLPILAFLLVVVSGCGGEDTKRSRLGAGQVVLIDGQMGSQVLAQPPLDAGLMPENGAKGTTFISLPAGTKVRVDSDPGDEKDANRTVTVTVMQGNYTSKALRVARKEIRPGK